MSLQVRCLSFRQPYAGLVLDGVKTVESRWRSVLGSMENQTLAVHIAQQNWEGEEWQAVLSGPLGMDRDQIQELLESGERLGRGVVAGRTRHLRRRPGSGPSTRDCKCLSGLVDVGKSWQCPPYLQGEELQHLERSAVLTGLQQKHLTQLSNPRWLKGPLRIRGGRDLWTVEIPAELLP